MFVRFLMTSPVITIEENESVLDAIHLMRKNKIRRLPVVDKKGALVGIVADIDVVEFSPSKASSLDRFELNYLIAKTPIQSIMSKEPYSVAPDDPIEMAAYLMEKYNIGGLPVISNGGLVGIITEIDVFRAFMQILGVKQDGIRLSVEIPNQTGELRKLVAMLSDDLVSKIISIASHNQGNDNHKRSVILRLETKFEAQIRQLFLDAGYKIRNG
jgi:acetoin utilization protein AcuB